MSNLVYQERVSEIEMPEFIGSNAMEGGKLSAGQQEIDTGGDISIALKKYGE